MGAISQGTKEEAMEGHFGARRRRLHDALATVRELARGLEPSLESDCRLCGLLCRVVSGVF